MWLFFSVATATRRGKRRGKRGEKEKKTRPQGASSRKLAPAGRHDTKTPVSKPCFECILGAAGNAPRLDYPGSNLLEMLNIPYVGSTADASRIAWNKPVAKSLAERAGVASPPSITLSRDAFRELGAESVLETVTTSLGIPLIVKPAQGGSAQGVSWVDSSEDLRKAMVHAFTYSDIALIEKRIVGVEVCVPIIDTGDGPRAIPAVEIEPLSGHYDFEARYTAGATRFYTPPRLEQATLDSLSALALDAFTALGLRDLARVDFIVDNEGKPWFLEASTMPGLTETSSTALALDAAGYDVGGVYGALVEAALARP